MEPKPKRSRRSSKDLPPELSELMTKLVNAAALFTTEFNSKAPRLRQIMREFQRIAADVTEMQERADRQRREARDTSAAPFRNIRASWGLSLLTVPFAAAAGAAAAVSANISQMLRENGSAKEVESLGKEFNRNLEPLTEALKEIRATCEKLEQKSTEAQARYSLSDMQDFQWILTRVTQLEKRSGELLHVTVDVLGIIGELVGLVVQVFRFTTNSEHDEKLRRVITQAAEKCEKVLDNLDGMETELRDFSSVHSQLQE